jgi:broad specificity phosphatase PhoE
MGETHLAIGGGESPEEVMARQIPVWELILSRTDEKNILVCIHGRAIRILLCHVMNVPLKNMDSFLHDNLCLYLLEYDGKDISIAKSNSVAHLDKIQRV